MSILIFDTETTGLFAGQICQLSYILEDDGVVMAKNFFFGVEYMHPAATNVHGFTVESLRELSGGRIFADDAEEIAADFAASSLIVSHNFSFDFMFLNIELERAGFQLICRDNFCTMRRFTPVLKLPRRSGNGCKYPKLSELMMFFGVGEDETGGFTEMLFGSGGRYHDARFDAAAVYLCVKKGCGYFPVLEEAMGIA